jgi:hypothetical protein
MNDDEDAAAAAAVSAAAGTGAEAEVLVLAAESVESADSVGWEGERWGMLGTEKGSERAAYNACSKIVC